MEFVVEGKIFKNAVDRVLATIAKFSYNDSVYCIGITADDKGVEIFNNSLDNYCKVRISGSPIVIEHGTAYVHKDDVKKVYGISGNIRVKCLDNVFTVTNMKKKASVMTKMNYDLDKVFWEDDGVKETLIYRNCADDLRDILSNVAVFSADVEDVNRLMTAIHFNANDHDIVALDGHRIIVYHDDCHFETGVNNLVNIPNVAAFHLKKVLSKNGGNVKVFVSKRFAKFVGEDFTYSIKIFDGEYYNYKALTGECATYGYCHINRKELLEASKEYAKLVKSIKKLPMFMGFDGLNKINTALFMPDYKTCDEIESKDFCFGEKFVYGFNPNFVKETMDIMSSDNITFYADGNNKKSVFFEDGNYKALILPVNIGNKIKIFYDFFEYTAA